MENQEMREPKLDRETANSQCKLGCSNSRMQYKYSPSNNCEQQNYRISNSEKIKEMQNEQNKQWAAKIEPKLDAYLSNENEQVDDETFFDDKYLEHSNNSRKRNIIQCMLKKTKLRKFKRIALQKK